MQKEKLNQPHYQESINKVLVYIEEHFKESNINIEKIAEHSNFGKRHFQKIMHAYLKAPIMEYVQRLKLETGAKLIMNKEMQLSEIAIIVGYDSIQSFSKAFKNYFGIPPSDYKNQVNNHYKSLNFKSMNIKEKIVNLNHKKVVYVRETGSYKSKISEKAWDAFWKFADEKQLWNEKTEYFGIIHDDPEVTKAEKCRYDACITVDIKIKAEGKTGFKELKGSKYAVFTYKGPYKKIENTYDEIFGEWVANNVFCEKPKYEIADEPILEKYLNDPEEVEPEELLTEIYIPLV